MKSMQEGEHYGDQVRAATKHRWLSLARILENSRYLIVIGVVSSLIASAAAFIWGAYKTMTLLIDLVAGGAKIAEVTAGLIALMDTFLIAAGLYIFAVAMYELFVDDLTLPAWLVVHNMHGVKTLLSGIIILVLAIVFLEHVIKWSDPQAILEIGIGTAAVMAALIAFNRFVEKE